MQKLIALLVIAGLTAGCGSADPAAQPLTRSALADYVRQVEPIRLAVNRLLNGADPILEGFHDKRITPKRAFARMSALEQRFASYMLSINELQPSVPALRTLNTAYAHTYILEDAYLSALASGLGDRDLDNLPNTQAAQRAAIIEWRTQLIILAQRLGLTLPGDIEQAGRGEIAPAPGGS
jgi:hypothetical protein